MARWGSIRIQHCRPWPGCELFSGPSKIGNSPSSPAVMIIIWYVSDLYFSPVQDCNSTIQFAFDNYCWWILSSNSRLNSRIPHLEDGKMGCSMESAGFHRLLITILLPTTLSCFSSSVLLKTPAKTKRVIFLLMLQEIENLFYNEAILAIDALLK